MSTPSADLTLQFLGWLAERPRTYADVMEAWRTSCPRLSIWEDALIDGLVEIAAGAETRDAAPVRLTSRGRAMLEAATSASRSARASRGRPRA